MHATHQQDTSPQIFFMPGVFNETFQLLQDARDYFQHYSEDDQSQYNEDMRSLYASEMSRITLRLSTIMAWTIAQRAVYTGTITAQEAVSHHGLTYQDVCLVDSSMLHGVLPTYVCYLLDRSYELYERVARLDAQLKRVH